MYKLLKELSIYRGDGVSDMHGSFNMRTISFSY